MTELQLVAAQRVTPAWIMVVLLFLVACPNAYAGPHFQTDDPEPVAFRHDEAYLFGAFDRAGGSTFAQVRASELNWGAAPHFLTF